MNTDTATGIETVVCLLVVATVVAFLTKRVRVPYTVALVVVGLTFGLAKISIPIKLSSELILLIFLPPLLFEGTILMDIGILKEKWREVFLLAIPVTLLSTFALGAVAHYILGYTWSVALLLGAILSPTDPISVLAIFREFGISKRLSLIVEAESCFNDGIGVVLFIIISRAVAFETVTIGNALWLFLFEVLGGLLIGIVIGFAVHRILKYIDDHLIEVMISVAVAYGSYALANRLHMSGVIAVVAAGLVFGNYGRILSMSPGTRLVLSSFWEVMAFIANSLLFLLMGVAIEKLSIGHYTWKVVLVFTSLILIRMILVYMTGLVLKLLRHPMLLNWQHTIGWAGLRGSIPLALVLGVILPSITDGVPSMDEFLSIVIGAIILSLLIQGMTIKPFLVRLGLIKRNNSDAEFERYIARRIAITAAMARLEEMNATGQIPQELFNEFQNTLDLESSTICRDMAEYLNKHKELAHSRRDDIVTALTLAEFTALEDAFTKGLISEETLSELRRELNEHMEKSIENQN